MRLRYGINPQQEASATPVTAGAWPVRVLSGQPSYLNLLDALSAWQLVREASGLLGRPAAASVKHTSPAGAAVPGPLDSVAARAFGVGGGRISDVATAYLRARDTDPRASYGDFAAVSDPVDADLAGVLDGLVCDGIIAPGFAPGTVARLSRKKAGRFLVLAADESYRPPAQESREIFGVCLTQDRDQVPLGGDLLEVVAGQPLSETAAADLLLALAVLRHTQSNSVCYTRAGMTLGIGAGQQSRVDCTRLAGTKADIWWLRRHPAIRELAFAPHVRRQEKIGWQCRLAEGDLTPPERLQLTRALALAEPAEPSEPAAELSQDDRAAWLRRLTGVAFASDGYLPFRDNVDHACRHGVTCIAEPGGSVRAADVVEACREHGVTLVRTGLRLFHH